MNPEFITHLGQALQYALLANLENQEMTQTGSAVDALTASDFKTVRLNCGIGAGHSTLIHRFSQPQDVVIVYRLVDAREGPFSKHNFDKCRVVAVHKLSEALDDVPYIGRVWVDAASLLSDVQLRSLYRVLAPKAKQIVLLG